MQDRPEVEIAHAGPSQVGIVEVDVVEKGVDGPDLFGDGAGVVAHGLGIDHHAEAGVVDLAHQLGGFVDIDDEVGLVAAERFDAEEDALLLGALAEMADPTGNLVCGLLRSVSMTFLEAPG